MEGLYFLGGMALAAGAFTLITGFILVVQKLYVIGFNIWHSTKKSKSVWIKFPTTNEEWLREFVRFLNETGTYNTFAFWAGGTINLINKLRGILKDQDPIDYFEILCNTMKNEELDVNAVKMSLAWKMIVEMYTRGSC